MQRSPPCSVQEDCPSAISRGRREAFHSIARRIFIYYDIICHGWCAIVKSYKAFKDACDKEDDGMASIVAMDGTCRKGWNLSEPQEGFIGMDLSEQ